MLGLPIALYAGLSKDIAFVVAAAMLAPVIAFALAARLRGGVIVGADGVLVQLGWRSRFVHLDEIKSIHRRPPHPEAELTTDAHWRVELDLTSGETVVIPTARRQPAPSKRVSNPESFVGAQPEEDDVPGLVDPAGVELLRAIELARSAHQVRRLGLADHEAPTLERGSRGGAEWLAQLRSLASQQTGGYRRAGVDLEELPKLVDHAGVKPAARVAAALVLAESGDEHARPRLRILADSVAEPRLREALVRIADADTDEDLAAALDRVPSEGRRAQRP